MPRFRVYLRPDPEGGQRSEEIEADGVYTKDGGWFFWQLVRSRLSEKSENTVMVFASGAWERVQRLDQAELRTEEVT